MLTNIYETSSCYIITTLSRCSLISVSFYLSCYETKKKKSSCRVTEEPQTEKPFVQKDLVVEN